jgi:hypothetical protein
MLWARSLERGLLDCKPLPILMMSIRVREAEHIETKQMVAIKILDKEKIMMQDLGESIKKEISLKQIIHVFFNHSLTISRDALENDRSSQCSQTHRGPR